MITAREDQVIHEVTTTLREWHKIWQSLYLDNQINLSDRIGTIIVSLVDLRANLISCLKQQNSQDATSKDQQISELKIEIINKLDFGNRLLNLDLVPRDPKTLHLVDPIELSPVKLYQLHSHSAASFNFTGQSDGTCQESNISTTASTISSLSQTSSEFGTPAINNPTSYHIQLGLKNHYLASLPPDELVQVYFSIVEVFNSNSNGSGSNAPISNPITDRYLVQIQNDEISCGVPNTIFTNLGPLNNRDVCLLVQVYRIGRMTLVDGHKTTFGRQQGSYNSQVSNQDGSTNSLSSANKYTPNGLSRSRQSTLMHHNGTPKYRRPFGATLVSLRDLIKSVNLRETTMNLKIVASSESEFSQSHELYYKRNHSIKTNQNISNIQLDISLRYLSCPLASLMQFSNLNQYCLTEKRGFPDIVMPGNFKNDLYFTLENAEFEKGGKSISKNIEASISLIDKAGIVIDNCISPGSNCDNVSCHRSCVFYHLNSPKWNESVKINVPLTEFDSAHIRIEFRHCSTKEKDKKFLGFAFLPLSDEDGTVIADKSHELYLYKCDSQLWEDESLNLCKYTSLPYGPAAKLSTSAKSTLQQNFSHSSREIISVSTYLLSTKLTQNSNLLNLLRWRELIKRDKKEFEEALKKALDLTGDEIVKFLQDILDTLFDTFTLYSTSEDDYSALIFKVLVHIFLLLDEPKYQHFKPVLDSYVSAHFSATLVHKGLLVCVKKCLEYSSIVERHVPIQKCFKSIKYVFQFIVQSKILYSEATGETNDELFLNDLRHLFKLFEIMLANSNPKLIPIQVTFLESFPGTLEQLVRVLSTQELAKLVTSLAGSVGFRLPPPLSSAKLIFMQGVARSTLITNQEIRLQITENFCKHLDCYIKHSEELELCYEVLEILVVKIHDYHWPSIYRMYQLTVDSYPRDTIETRAVMTVGEINSLTQITQIQANRLDLAIISVSKELEPFVNLMEPLLHLLEKLDFSSARLIVQKYCTCLLTILKLMGKTSFDQFMKRRKMDYSELCDLFRTFRAVYNHDWSIMQLTSHAILEHPISEISKDIKTKSQSHHFNKQLGSYIKLIVDFITHPTLQLEAFSERKKTYVTSVFGDLRLKFSSQLIRFWSELTKANICDLIPASIQSFLDATLLPSDELQCKLVPVFYDMIDAEDHFKSKSNETDSKWSFIERCMMDNLDLFINLDRCSDTFVKNFDGILRRMVEEKSPTWKQRGMKLINSLVKLIRLLMSYRKSLESWGNRNKQMNYLVELLNFYKHQDRIDLHLKYLFKLCDMHLEVGNHTEAAFTLKLYTDEIRFSDRMKSPLEDYRPEEEEWRRKEALYQRIIHYFNQGKCWEETIGLCKELASFYEDLVDYEKVSSTLKKLAHFLDCILSEHRPEREYFRVEFIGADVPDYVKGREFIYRGGEYERLPAFMQRMNLEFPEAEILNSKSKQTVNKDSSGQFLIISNVKPVPYLQGHFKSGQRNINDKVIQYYLNNRLDTFSYDIPIIKNNPSTNSNNKEKTSDLNIKNLWVGRYMLKLKKQLPDILPWSEITSQEYIEISPINHAIETISNMNLELTKLILSYKNEPNKQISPLTMRLQGVIEAAVNGGPSVFINAFLKRQPGDNDVPQQDQESLTRLRDLIKQQFSILDTGLALHVKLAPPEVRPLHDRLVERLQNTKKTLLEEQIQSPENNYEVLYHKSINNNAARIPNNESQASASSSDGTYAKDEVDSHSDVNGNIYGDLDDQTYSQPNDPHFGRLIRVTDGSKSELSSPSRHQYNYGNSSSLSTIAVLSNLPVNRTRAMSITPSKEPCLHQQVAVNNLSSNELCARAARKLNYEPSTRSTSGERIDGRNSDLRLSPSVSNTTTPDQEAPPLPPRTFVVGGDKHSASRTMNRSPFLLSRTSSPSELGAGPQRWQVNDSLMMARNLASLSSTEANRVLQSLDHEPPLRLSIPSNLPRLMKCPPPVPGETRQEVSNADPPPLPQRMRVATGVQPQVAVEHKLMGPEKKELIVEKQQTHNEQMHISSASSGQEMATNPGDETQLN